MTTFADELAAALRAQERDVIRATIEGFPFPRAQRTALPAQHRLMAEIAINTGLRRGELIALKPRHLNLTKRTLTVEETIVEVSLRMATYSSGVRVRA